MKFAIAFLSFALISIPVGAQRSITLQVDFENGQGIETAFVTKAWTDSVDIYFNAELAQHGPPNLARVNRPAGSFANYRLLVQSIPMMAGAQPSGLTAYSLIFFRPPAVGNSWQYVTSEVGYTRSPRDAAIEMLRMVTATLRAR